MWGEGVALVPEQTIEKPYGWVFSYNSLKWIESRSFDDMLLGNAPIIVDRFEGEIRVTGTAHPTEHYLARYEASLPPARLVRSGGRPAK
jgi:hypothetical protein